jgi:FkbM family methyltransferase
MNLLQRLTGSRSPKLERPFRAFAGYLLQGAGLSDRFQVRRSHHYSVPFFARSNVALSLWVNPDIIDPAEEFAYELLQEGDTLIDVGANIGCVTAAGALAVGPRGRVVAIEPHPQTFHCLQQTIALNKCPNVTAINCALGAEAGVVNFSNERRKDDVNRVQLNGPGLQVPCRTLDDLVQELALPRIALLKIDVEGFEMHVLRGAVDTLSRVDSIYIEVLEHTLERFGSSAAGVMQFLRERGFHLFRFRNDPDNVVGFVDPTRAAHWQNELLPL